MYAGLKQYQTFLCFKTCFTNAFTSFDSIQLRSSGWVRKLPDPCAELGEGRNDLYGQDLRIRSTANPINGTHIEVTLCC